MKDVMLCERCNEKYVFHVLVSKANANRHTEVTCSDCLDPEVDELWANIALYPGREINLENKYIHRGMTHDLSQHRAALREIGFLN